jgi:hypothetical protein
LNANIDFILNWIVGQPDENILGRHALWADCMIGGRAAVEEQWPMLQATVVTEHVLDAFKEQIPMISYSKYRYRQE